MSSVVVAPPQAAVKQVVIDNLIKQYGSLRALGGVSFDVGAGWLASCSGACRHDKRSTR